MGTSNGEHAGIAGWGIDLTPDRRPGVPYEATPHPLAGAHWLVPAPQPAAATVLKSASIAELTPVFGTATPPRGLSGEIRRAAYTIPDHRVSHWILLMAADRVDVIESDVGGFLKRAWPAVLLAGAIGVGIALARRPKRRFRWR